MFTMFFKKKEPVTVMHTAEDIAEAIAERYIQDGFFDEVDHDLAQLFDNMVGYGEMDVDVATEWDLNIESDEFLDGFNQATQVLMRRYFASRFTKSLDDTAS
jgi:hypothetical protein